MLIRRTVILAKEETTPGTFSNPTAASNALLVSNLQMSTDTRINYRSPYRLGFARPESSRTLPTATLSFDMEIAGSGSGAIPQIAPLLRACGLTVKDSTWYTDIAKGSSAAAWVFVPDAAEETTVSIYVNRDGIRHQFVGCRGTFKMGGEAGGFAVISFSFMGYWLDVADAALPEPTLNFTRPKIIENANLSLHGVNICAIGFAIDLGNALDTRVTAGNDRGGFASMVIANRFPTISATIEAVALAAHDMPNALRDGDVGEFWFDIGGQGDGNGFTFYAPATQITVNKERDINGRVYYETLLEPMRDAGDLIADRYSTNVDDSNFVLVYWK